MADKNTLKNWFRTGLKPLQEQFWAWMDSYWHKDEKIPITAIDDVENILNEKADAEALANHLTDNNAHVDLFDAKLKFSSDIVVSLSNGKTAGKYSNGQTIPLVGKTPQQAFNDIFRETLFPNLVNPSLGNLTLNKGLTQEVGETLANLILSATFSRGSISPQYAALSDFRSGLPMQHLFTGIGINTVTASTSLNLNNTIASYVVAVGANNFTAQVNYDVGVQPKDSMGNDFNTALAAGSSNVSAATIQGILPYFFGKSSGAPIANQALINTGTKVVASSGGDIAVNFNSNSEYLWFAIPASSASKTKWYVDAINNASIGSASDLFGAFATVIVNSPIGLWTNQSYKIYISNYATSQGSLMQLKNS